VFHSNAFDSNALTVDSSCVWKSVVAGEVGNFAKTLSPSTRTDEVIE
jgi:hypothetical protein